MLLQWELDSVTAQAARDFPLHIDGVTPAKQFSGRAFNPQNWKIRTLSNNGWLTCLVSSPDNIIIHFQKRAYLEALAMIVTWGTMSRQYRRIYGQPLPLICRTLEECHTSIQATKSIQEAWHYLTGHRPGGLAWSAVMASKTLHFMARAAGFIQCPPVPLDNAVVRKLIWPAFIQQVPAAQRPDGWNGNSFDAYNRYMTAINTWAKKRDWTTTEVETTLFDQYR